jgi:hypothetical protein
LIALIKNNVLATSKKFGKIFVEVLPLGLFRSFCSYEQKPRNRPYDFTRNPEWNPASHRGRHTGFIVQEDPLKPSNDKSMAIAIANYLNSKSCHYINVRTHLPDEPKRGIEPRRFPTEFLSYRTKPWLKG